MGRWLDPQREVNMDTRYGWLIGADYTEVYDYLTGEDIFSDDMTRISTTDTDTYFFYQINKDREDRCVEVYFDDNNIVTEIIVNRY